ncbi:MAG TPA: amidohydrolase family protein, partial [Pseudoflavonifractor sp.]|nr:amidohydrolase family protein [Pseudoflavonifractor sp.]
EVAGYPVNIVHLSTLRGLEVVRSARRRGQELYVESCLQYFLLNDDKYLLPGFESAKYMLSPPLRSPENSAALWAALESGEIDTMGTDHCSFHFNGVKTLGRDDFSKIPNGMPGVEDRAVLMYSEGVVKGHMSAADMARVLSEQPARLFGMYPRKGVLAVGSDADLVLWDPEAHWTISAANQTQAVDYNPYEGWNVTGKTDTVLLNGEVVVEGGALVKVKAGRFVHRGPAQFWRG